VLSKVGGLDLAAMCGAYLGAAASRVPVLIDGVISAVAALCAVRLCPNAASAMLASHVSAEPAGQRVMQALGKRALLTAQLRLGEGSGAVAAMQLLDMALAVYDSGETFSKRGIKPYTKLS
jgi:nicotinate-nucleotide--dimethylbenzimidazole phosphoribosyltransferase